MHVSPKTKESFLSMNFSRQHCLLAGVCSSIGFLGNTHSHRFGATYKSNDESLGTKSLLDKHTVKNVVKGPNTIAVSDLIFDTAVSPKSFGRNLSWCSLRELFGGRYYFISYKVELGRPRDWNEPLKWRSRISNISWKQGQQRCMDWVLQCNHTICETRMLEYNILIERSLRMWNWIHAEQQHYFVSRSIAPRFGIVRQKAKVGWITSPVNLLLTQNASFMLAPLMLTLQVSWMLLCCSMLTAAEQMGWTRCQSVAHRFACKQTWICLVYAYIAEQSRAAAPYVFETWNTLVPSLVGNERLGLCRRKLQKAVRVVLQYPLFSEQTNVRAWGGGGQHSFSIH